MEEIKEPREAEERKEHKAHWSNTKGEREKGHLKSGLNSK